MKYLIIECEELHDQFECEANRTPVCMTDDFYKFNKIGYEIYKLCDDGTFKLIKHYSKEIKKDF